MSWQTLLAVGAAEVGRFALHALPWTLLGAVVGLVAGIVLVAWLGRRGAWRRSHWLWNGAVKVFYLWVPLVLMLGGGSAGLVHSVHRQTQQVVDARLAPLARANLPSVREWLLERVEWGGAQSMPLEEAVRRVLRALHVQPASDGWWDRTRARAANYVTLNGGKWVVSAGLAAMLNYGLGKAGETVGVGKDTVRFSVSVIKEMDLSRVDDNFFEILRRATRDALGGLFWGFHAQVLLLVGLGLAVPALEGTAWVLWRRLGNRRPAS